MKLEREKSAAWDGQVDDSYRQLMYLQNWCIQKLKKRFSHSGWQTAVLSYFFPNGRYDLLETIHKVTFPLFIQFPLQNLFSYGTCKTGQQATRRLRGLCRWCICSKENGCISIPTSLHNIIHLSFEGLPDILLSKAK